MNLTNHPVFRWYNSKISLPARKEQAITTAWTKLQSSRNLATAVRTKLFFFFLLLLQDPRLDVTLILLYSSLKEWVRWPGLRIPCIDGVVPRSTPPGFSLEIF